MSQWVVERAGSNLCPVMNFGISICHPLDSITRELVGYEYMVGMVRV
jgi:hypothetical protein